MKAKAYYIPCPTQETWDKIMKVYGVPNYKYDGKVLTKVVLPPGWVVKPNEPKFPNSYFIFNEYNQKVAQFYADESKSFIKFDNAYLEVLHALAGNEK